MSQQSVALSLFLIFFSFGLCFGSYIEEPHNLKSYNQRYSDPRRLLLETKHEHFGTMLRAHHHHSRPQRTFNVDDYGARSADGRDDNEAFEKAWNDACSRGGTLMVPENGVYHLKPIIFSGPCQPNTTFMIHGTIKAWPKISAYEKDRRFWVLFNNISNLQVNGGGTFNGNGRIWWENSCKVNESLPCQQAPTAVTFSECKNLTVTNLRSRNAQQMHIRFQRCSNVNALNLVVTAPGDSPNTDGIHVSDTQNIIISNSVIGTGDDCISIVSGSQNVRATDITCGPGHGISIGSLGAGNSEAQVSNVVVNRATLKGTTNGVRIKTWQGGSGYAKDIRFMNIAMQNVSNPIIIDQNYCDQKEPCQEQGSAVELSNVMYKNIIGTSASEVAIRFDCSKSVPCRAINLQNVVLTPEHDHHGGTIATCENVKYSNTGNSFPQCSS